MDALRKALIGLLAATATTAGAQELPVPSTGPGEPPAETEPQRPQKPPPEQGAPEFFIRDSHRPAEAHREGEYGGVIPGAAGRKRRPPRRLVVSWVGFQARDGGGARVFLQLSRAAKLAQKVVGSELVLTISGARLDLRNNARALDTRYFGTSVTRVWARRRGKAVEVHVKFKGTPSTGTASLEKARDGWTYVLLDVGGGGSIDVSQPPAEDAEGG